VINHKEIDEKDAERAFHRIRKALNSGSVMSAMPG